jgi:methionyl-tRNA formyltransferase
LNSDFQVSGVVTTPPQPKGRNLTLIPSEVETFSKLNKIQTFTPENLTVAPSDMIGTEIPDFFVVAGYGKLLPESWLNYPKIMAINMHPSLLPKYRGRFPAEWAILNREKETGATLIKMNPKFDQGMILAQSRVNIEPIDTKETLYNKLFKSGAELILETLPQINSGRITPTSQSGASSYARGITREDGYIPWEVLQLAMKGIEPDKDKTTPLMQEIMKNTGENLDQWVYIIDRMLRALLPWPGVWTIKPDGKRLKLLAANIELRPTRLNLNLVQEESGKPKMWTGFSL